MSLEGTGGRSRASGFFMVRRGVEEALGCDDASGVGAGASVYSSLDK